MVKVLDRDLLLDDEVELAKLLNIINSNSQDKLKTIGELAKIYLEEALAFIFSENCRKYETAPIFKI